MTAEPESLWHRRPEAGHPLGLRLVAWIAARLGRRTLQFILHPVTAYYLLMRAPERSASRSYLRRVYGRPARLREVYQHFYCFARVTADRFFFLTGAHVPIEFVGGDDVLRVVRRGKPGIFLAAHFGSFEAARIVGPRLGGIELRIVLAKQINQRLVEMTARLNPQMVERIIDASQPGLALGLAIAQAFKEHAWVGFLADRNHPQQDQQHRRAEPASASSGRERTTTCQFLGAPARFPTGPYVIANTFKAPLICVFCRVTPRGYEVHCEVLSDAVTIDREHRQTGLDALVEAYVRRLEYHVRAAPLGWFNFYDFWAMHDETRP